MCHGHGNRDFEAGKECIVCTVFFYHWPRCAPLFNYDSSWHPDFVLSQGCVSFGKVGCKQLEFKDISVGKQQQSLLVRTHSVEDLILEYRT